MRFTGGLIGAGLVVALSAANEPAWARGEFSSGSWRGAAYPADGGAFTHCSMRGSYRDGTILMLSLFRGSQLMISVIVPKWDRVSRSLRVPTTVRIDNGAPLAATGLGVAPNHLGISVTDSPRMIDLLRVGSRMSIDIGDRGNAVTFPLTGINEAVNRLMECVTQELNRGQRSANAPTAPGNGERPRAMTDRAAMTPVARAALDERRETVRREIPMPAVAEGAALDPQDLFRRVSPSIFQIRSVRRDGRTRLGSAVAIAPLTMITNCHIIDGAREITALQGSRSYRVTVWLGDSPDDRCFLRTGGDVTLTPVSGIRTFGSVEVGERVYTLGHPAGLSLTLGEGLVSARHELRGLNVVQSTAQISEGSSGGGLFDARGNLVAVPTFYLRILQGHGFAIAAEDYWR